MISNGPEIIQNESDSTELLASRSTGHVCGFGLCRVATLFLQELNHEQFDLQGPPAVMQERPPVCVTRLQEFVRSSVSCV